MDDTADNRRRAASLVRGFARDSIRLLSARLMPNVVLDMLRAWAWGENGQCGRLSRVALRVFRHSSLAGREPFKLLDDPGVILTAADTSLTQQLYWYGGTSYEPALTQWWRWFVSDAHSVLEVGCNIGFFTVIGRQSNTACRYRAVDANPDACDLLRQNLRLNGLEADVINAAAVGTNQTEVTLAFPLREPSHAPTMAYVPSNAATHLPVRHERTVPATRARDLVQDADLIKLDIEGSEYSFLSDALPRISENTATLIVEVLPDAHELVDLLSPLLETTFDAFIPDFGRLRPLELDALRTPRPDRDVVLIPQSQRPHWLRQFAF